MTEGETMRGQPLVIAEQDRHTLASWARAPKTEQRLAWRARLLLALATGQRARAVAQAFHTRPSTVSKWNISTDPMFAQKAADIVGLYLNPPEHALVLCVDEKPRPFRPWNERKAVGAGTVRGVLRQTRRPRLFETFPPQQNSRTRRIQVMRNRMIGFHLGGKQANP